MLKQYTQINICISVLADFQRKILADLSDEA